MRWSASGAGRPWTSARRSTGAWRCATSSSTSCGALGQHLDVPAHLLHARRRALEVADRQSAGMGENKAQRPRALLVQLRHLPVGASHRGATTTARNGMPKLRRAFELRAVVLAVDARLDHHRARDAEHVEQVARLLRGRRRRGVFAFIDHRVARQRPEQMKMRYRSRPPARRSAACADADRGLGTARSFTCPSCSVSSHGVSMRRAAEAASSLATLVYPIISPLGPPPLSEQSDSGDGPMRLGATVRRSRPRSSCPVNERPDASRHRQIDLQLLRHRGRKRRRQCLAPLGVEASHAAQVAGEMAARHEGLDQLLGHQRGSRLRRSRERGRNARTRPPGTTR